MAHVSASNGSASSVTARWRIASRRSAGDAARVVLAVLMMSSGPHLHAATLLQWDIPISASGSAGTTNGSTATNGAGVSGISGSVITINGSLAGTLSASGWRWYDQTGNVDLTTGLSGTNYFSWSVTTNGVTTATITGLGSTSFSRGASAPNSLALLYSTTSSFATYRTVSGSTAIQTAATDISSGLAGDLSGNNIVLNPGSTGYFRLVFWGGTTTTSGAIWVGSASTTNDFSLVGTATASVAQRTLTWNGVGGGGSTWDTSTGNLVWLDSGTSTYFNDGDNATFTAASTVNVTGGGVSAGSVAVSNASGSVVIQGGSLTAGALTKTGAGTLELSGSNSFTSVSATAGVIQIAAGTALGANPVGLDGTQLATTAGVTTVGNAINVASGGATLNVAGTTAFTGVINTVAGAPANTSYGLTKDGSGTLTIDKVLGTQMTKNTSGGAFTLGVNAGGLTLSGNTQKNLGGAMAWNGNVSITAGTVMLHAGTVTGSGTVSIDGASTVQSRLNYGKSSIANRTVVNAPLTLNASSSASLEMTGTMTGAGGITTSGNGTVRLLGVGTDGVSTLSGTLAVNSNAEAVTQALGSLTPVVGSGWKLTFVNTTDGTFAGPISGAGTVAVGGSAKTSLSGSNTYAGGTLLDGDVGITSVWNGSFGSLGSGTITAISSAARIYLESGSSITFSQPVNTGTAATSVLAFAGTGKTFNLTGPVAGVGQLKASTGAILDLTAQTALTNLNTGGVEIGNAYVRAASDANLGGGTVNFSATSNSSGFIAAATGTISRPITVGSTGTNASVRAIFDTSGSNLTLTGGISDKAGTAQGQVVKTGAGTLTLQGSNPYTGTTTVAAGGLAVDGLLDASPVTVLAGAMLAGSGTIGGATTITGILAPGGGLGTLTVTNDVVWAGAAAAGSTTDWLFDLAAGNVSDLLAITGGTSDFLKDATNGTTYRFDFGNSPEQGTFTLVTWGGTTDFTASDFSYTGLPDGNTATFAIVGNSLTVMVVPEPGAIALGGLGLAVGALARWRRGRGRRA